MGYTHLTDISKFISPFEFTKTAGTWSPTFSSNLVSDVRTAAAAAFKLIIPVSLPGSTIKLQGAKLVSIDLIYKIATKDATAFTVTLVKTALGANETAAAGSVIPSSLDAAHDTAAKCYAQKDHTLKCSVTTPFFIGSDEAVFMVVEVTAADNTVFTNFGAVANFTLRL
jgi:hypothetical protein